jgi:hypothetical protein
MEWSELEGPRDAKKEVADRLRKLKAEYVEIVGQDGCIEVTVFKGKGRQMHSVDSFYAACSRRDIIPHVKTVRMTNVY